MNAQNCFYDFSMIYGVKNYWQEEWVGLNNSLVYVNKDSQDIMRWQDVKLITISSIHINKIGRIDYFYN